MALKTDRNAQIVDDREARLSMALIGRKHGISRERVRQILAAHAPELLGNFTCIGCQKHGLRSGLYCRICRRNYQRYGEHVPDVIFGDGDVFRIINFLRHTEERGGHTLWTGSYRSSGDPIPTGPIYGEQRPARILWTHLDYPKLPPRSHLYRRCNEPSCIKPEHHSLAPCHQAQQSKSSPLTDKGLRPKLRRNVSCPVAGSSREN